MQRAIERVKTVTLLALLVSALCFAWWQVDLMFRLPDRASFAVPPPGKETSATLHLVRAGRFAVEARVLVDAKTPVSMTGPAPCRFVASFESRDVSSPGPFPVALRQRPRFGDTGMDSYVSDRVSLAAGSYGVRLHNLGCAADTPMLGGVATAWEVIGGRFPRPLFYQIAAMAGLLIGLAGILAWRVMAMVARPRLSTPTATN